MILIVKTVEFMKYLHARALIIHALWSIQLCSALCFVSSKTPRAKVYLPLYMEMEEYPVGWLLFLYFWFLASNDSSGLVLVLPKCCLHASTYLVKTRDAWKQFLVLQFVMTRFKKAAVCCSVRFPETDRDSVRFGFSSVYLYPFD